MYLYSNIPFNKILDGSIFTIKEDCYFWISYNQKLELPDIETAYLTYERTKVYWLDWCSRTKRFSQFKEEIDRSALVLKLLSFQKTGAILAAATTSIPESIGQGRNWDYRYCWIRDGSMILSTFSKIGHNNVVKRYIHFLLNIIPYKNETIQVMYGINGEKNLKESVLKHLSGYANSKPVRIGNAAFKQQQNDVYGVLMEIIYQTILAHDEDIGFIEDLWTMVRTLMRTVEYVWSKPDKGIWEMRGRSRHFVFSKVLCWVAVDRAVKIAQLFDKYKYSLQWSQLRDTIKHDIMQKGWNPRIGSFTQSYGRVHLDAANLLFEPYGFISADDPMYIWDHQQI
jgi:GH15 family glucan-1,4-alpha-glucosidase